MYPGRRRYPEAAEGKPEGRGLVPLLSRVTALGGATRRSLSRLNSGVFWWLLGVLVPIVAENAPARSGCLAKVATAAGIEEPPSMGGCRSVLYQRQRTICPQATP